VKSGVFEVKSGVDVQERQQERKGWSKIDCCGSKTRNGKLHDPKRERGVLNCSISIPRGYETSSSTKTAVEAKRGLEICLIWVKNAKHEIERSETCAKGPEAFQVDAWRSRKVLSAKTLAETEWMVKS